MDSRKYIIVATAIAAVAAGSWLSWQILQTPEQPETATLLPAPADLVGFSLIDQDGNAFTRDSFKGQWSLVFFGFTHCPDICPLTLQVLADARREIQARGLDQLPRIVLVSVDPERDSPAVMARYVSHFGDDVIGVSGEMAELRKLTTGLGIYFGKSNVDGDNYSVDHSAVVIVVNPQGKFVALFSAPHVAGNFAHDLPILMSRH